MSQPLDSIIIPNDTNLTELDFNTTAEFTAPIIPVLCGPLFNYRGMRSSNSPRPTWHGTVVIVTPSGCTSPELKVKCCGAISEVGSVNVSGQCQRLRAIKLYEDVKKVIYRYSIELPVQSFEARWQYSLENVEYEEPRENDIFTFVVPAIGQSMRIVFHSCNGFNFTTDYTAYCGPNGTLWQDVLRMHLQRPFHVMLGGGDQIYNDGVRAPDGPLKAWTDISNPIKRQSYPFTENLRAKCDAWYYENYRRWFSSRFFRDVNSRIPQVNIWDDHDIIDGFGSYADVFMKCSVFRGLGEIAYKYYSLFQHHLAPPKSTYGVPESALHGNNTYQPEPVSMESTRLKSAYVYNEPRDDTFFITGSQPGAYIEPKSRSIYCRLGARIALLAIDGRTERTRHQINYPQTYEIIFQRIKSELEESNGEIKHLIIMVGVPIAYPRLQWLESFFLSPLLGPLRLLHRHFGIAKSLFNKFDGQIDLLDDLDDHYTARLHKKERTWLLTRLQDIARVYSVRVTILSGDVHLAAVGRFFSNAKLSIPIERDYRYMVNVVSSAITNKPPPYSVANFLARRNKVHHLDSETDETLLELFNRDPGAGKITSDFNRVAMPSRNYVILCESDAPDTSPSIAKENIPAFELFKARLKNPRLAICAGEFSAGTDHPAASGLISSMSAGPNSLDVTFRIEIDSTDITGTTEGYGMSIAALESASYQNYGEKW